MTLLEKIKILRRKIAQHDIALWECLPVLLAIIIPNILEPAWMWRMVSYCTALFFLIVIFLHGVIAPELTFNAKIKYDWSPKGKLWFARISYALLIGGLIFAVYWSIFPMGDLYRVINNQGKAPLDEKIINVIETEGGGSVAPYFVGQRLRTEEGRYELPFSLRRWGTGTYKIIYSPKTNIIYEIIPVR